MKKNVKSMIHLEFFSKLGNLSFLYRYEIPFLLYTQAFYIIKCASELSVGHALPHCSTLLAVTHLDYTSPLIKRFQKNFSTFCILRFLKEIWDHFVMFRRIGNWIM